MRQRACSTVQAGKVFGIQTTVLTLEPPKLVCRVLLGSYKWGWKDFYFGELKFYSLFWVSWAIWDHFLTKYSKVGSKINVHQNENPSNPICMNPKVPYIPILVVLGPKLWAVSQKLCQPEQLNMHFLVAISECVIYSPIFYPRHHGGPHSKARMTISTNSIINLWQL